MANENKITQIIINQEPYTIGEDSAGFTTLTGSEMISTLKSGFYLLNSDSNLVAIALTVANIDGTYFLTLMTAENICMYYGNDTTLANAMQDRLGILLAATDTHSSFPIFYDDTFIINELPGAFITQFVGGKVIGLAMVSNTGLSGTGNHRVIVIAAEGKALQFVGSENTELNNAMYSAEPFMASEPEDITTKKYVDTAVAQAGGIPKYDESTLVKDMQKGSVFINTAAHILQEVSQDGARYIYDLNPGGSIYVYNYSETLTGTDLLTRTGGTAFMAKNSADIVSKAFADQTYTSKNDYNTLNSTVQELQETIATLQATITQLQGNALTELDRQTLDVLENKS